MSHSWWSRLAKRRTFSCIDTTNDLWCYGRVLKNLNAFVNYSFCQFFKGMLMFPFTCLATSTVFEENNLRDFERRHFSLHGYVHSQCHFCLSPMYVTTTNSWLCIFQSWSKIIGREILRCWAFIFVLLCLNFFFQKLIHKEVTSSLHLVGRVTQRPTITSRGLPVHATTEDSSTFLFDEQTLDVELFQIILQWILDIPACLQLRFLLEIFPQSIHPSLFWCCLFVRPSKKALSTRLVQCVTFSLKVFTIKYVMQNIFNKYDWLWRAMPGITN